MAVCIVSVGITGGFLPVDEIKTSKAIITAAAMIIGQVFFIVFYRFRISCLRLIAGASPDYGESSWKLIIV
jgi:hypothetical protein